MLAARLYISLRNTKVRTKQGSIAKKGRASFVTDYPRACFLFQLQILDSSFNTIPIIPRMIRVSSNIYQEKVIIEREIEGILKFTFEMTSPWAKSDSLTVEF
jgi:hypothetical protein